MPSLHDIQRSFAAALLDSKSGVVAPLIRSHGISPARRFEIYRISVFENYRKALTAMFPVIEQLVGAEYFSMLSKEYVRRVAAPSGDIGECGAAFADFIQTHRVNVQLPYLADVARLEWAVETVFHAAHTPPVTMEQLSQLDVRNMSAVSMQLAPRCALLYSQFPVHRIWEIHQPGADLDLHLDLTQDEVHLLVIRHSDPYQIEIRPVTASDFAMLMLLASATPLAQALRCVVANHPEFDLSPFLQRYVPPGVLYGLTVDARVRATRPSRTLPQ